MNAPTATTTETSPEKDVSPPSEAELELLFSLYEKNLILPGEI